MRPNVEIYKHIPLEREMRRLAEAHGGENEKRSGQWSHGGVIFVKMDEDEDERSWENLGEVREWESEECD